jgi:coenzyme PQQ precursor peptide PqqA
MRSGQITAQKQPATVPVAAQQVTERRVWFPPDFQDFETAMEVTAYAGRR